MIDDVKGRFQASAQAITSVSVASTDVVEVGAANIGRGEPIKVIHTPATTFVGGTALTLRVEGATVSTFGAPITLCELALVDVTPTAGDQFETTINASDATNLRFLRCVYTPTGTYSAGSITSRIAPGGAGTPINSQFPDNRGAF